MAARRPPTAGCGWRMPWRTQGAFFVDSGPLGLIRAFNARHAPAGRRRVPPVPLLTQIHNVIDGVFVSSVGPSLRSVESSGSAGDSRVDRAPRIPSADLGADAGLQHRRTMAARGDRVGARPALSDWELCIADDASTDPKVGEVLRRVQSQDSTDQGRFRAGEWPHLGRVEQRAGTGHR